MEIVHLRFFKSRKRLLAWGTFRGLFGEREIAQYLQMRSFLQPFHQCWIIQGPSPFTPFVTAAWVCFHLFSIHSSWFGDFLCVCQASSQLARWACKGGVDGVEARARDLRLVYNAGGLLPFGMKQSRWISVNYYKEVEAASWDFDFWPTGRYILVRARTHARSHTH